MKQYKIFLVSLLFIPALWSCFDDEGNYDYNAINELKIKEYGDSTYYMMYLADTLRIKPVVEGSMDPEFSDKDYEYQWLVRDNNDLSGNSWGTVISTSRNLEYPIDLKPGSYSLYFKVRDKKTGLLFKSHSTVQVSTTLTRGFIVLGDDEEGYIRMDMISMLPEQDTVVLRNILKDSGLPPIKGAVNVCHTGSTYNPDYIRFWVMGKEESYYVNGADMTGLPGNTLRQMFYSSLVDVDTVHPIEVFPRSSAGRQNGSVRGMMFNDGSIVSSSIIAGEFYGNPVNRLAKNPEHLLPMAPYVFYPMGTSLQGYMAYDTENEQFLFAMYSSANMSLRNDYTTDPFPWKQGDKKRTLVYGENTRNTYGGSSYGASYALMKDKDNNYFIYGFNVYVPNQWFSPTKLGAWQIKKDIAENFDQATLYMFSSSRTLMYYAAAGNIYCYDYNVGNERCESVLETGTDEVTYLQADLQTASRPYNYIFVGTYNSTTGGTLSKYEESTNQNEIKWTPVERSSWSHLCKIKSVEWRNSQD